MLTVTYNGNDIPLDADFSIRLTFVNPACYFDKIPGDYGIGIEIPVNRYSMAYFGHPHRFEKDASTNDRKFENVEIRFDGILLMIGTLNITNATNERYSAWLQANVGSIGEAQREKYINELDWGDFNNFNNTANFDDDTSDYCTGEINNKRFWEDMGRMVTEKERYVDDEHKTQTRDIEISYLQQQHRDNFNYKVNLTHGGIVKTEGAGCVVSPFLFLKYIIKNILLQFKFYIDPNNNAFDTIQGYKNIAVYNNYNLMVPIVGTDTIETYEEDPITGDFILMQSEEVTSVIWFLDQFKYSMLVPRINIGEFLLGLQNTFNFVFLFRNDMQVSIIDRNSILSMTAFDVDIYKIGNWTLGERKNVTLKFIQEYDKDDSVIGDNFHDLTERRNDIKADVNWLRDVFNPDYGEIRRLKRNDTYYEYKWDVGIENTSSILREFDKVDWVFLTTGPQPIWYGAGDEIEEIKSKISVPYSLHDGDVRVSQKGSTFYMRNLWNNFSPRLFFYRGNNTVQTINTEDGTSLRWAGDDGLFNQRWKRWADYWKNRIEIEGSFNFPMNVLSFMISNITGKFKTIHGEFIISEMEVEVGLHMIGETRIKGFKL